MEASISVDRQILRNIIPMFPPMIIFGIIFGFTGNLGGYSLFIVSSMSYIIFAGSAQFIILLLLMDQQPFAAIIITAILINSRHAIYGIAMNTKLRANKWKRMILAYFLIDESFLAFNLTMKSVEGRTEVNPDTVFLRTAIPMWLIWNVFTIIGFLLFEYIGDQVVIPENFIIASTFVGFLVDQWRKESNRWIILLSTGLCFVFGFVFDNSIIFILVMMIGIIVTMYRHRGVYDE